ncbi:MAG TPA: zinc ribbon domain-containing protein [Paraburkholderia sp.]
MIFAANWPIFVDLPAYRPRYTVALSMFDKSGRDDTGTSQCPYCGNRLATSFIFCPQCGASQQGAQSDADRDPPFEYAPMGMQLRARRAWRVLYICGALAVVGFAAYLAAPSDGPTHRAQIAGGITAGANHGPPNEDATPADASMDAPSGLLPQRDIDIAGLNVAQAPSQPDADTDIAGPDIASESVPSAASVEPASKSDAATRIDVTRQLAIVRTDLGRNDLWPAQRALANALSAQPANADAQRMRTDLASREQDRNALIEHARLCERSGQWACAREYAERAVRVDKSSLEAKRLLARASGNRRETVGYRGDPNLLVRLHHWFEQSIAQSESKPAASPSPWNRP